MAKITDFFKRGTSTPLVPYIRRFAEKSQKSRAYKRKYWNLADKLAAYEQHRGTVLLSDSLRQDVAEDILLFLKSQFPYRVATLRSLFGLIPVILKRIDCDGFKVDWGISEIKIKQEDTVAVYLTTDEIERINALVLRKDAALVRDRFIIGCCTGLRYSDYSRLNADNLSGGIIQVRTTKTGAKVVLPLHWMVEDVIRRNKGEFPAYSLSRQNFNKIIKTVCKRAGIADPVLIERTEGHKPVKRKLKKWELVSSHTARRSFATNMYLAGVATAKIMLCTGHTTEEAFFKYIRIGKQENASELANHPFFKKSSNLAEGKQ